MLVPIPIVCFVGTLAHRHRLLEDRRRCSGPNMSAWLLTVGLVVSVLVVLAGLIDFLGDRRIRALRRRLDPRPRQRAGAGAGDRQRLRPQPRRLHLGRADRPDPVGARRADPAGHRLERLGDGLPPRRRRAVGGPADEPRSALGLCAAAASALAACGGPSPIDPHRQIGANPYLPDDPPVPDAADACGQDRRAGAARRRPCRAGLQVKALATGLKNPRSLYVLPNGDVLVVETDGPKAPINRPKEFVMNWIEKQAHSSDQGRQPHPAAARRQRRRRAGLRTVFLDHLNSPFGVVLVGNDLYVANTDAVMRFPYQTGQTQITAPGVKLTDLPGGPIDHHWTKSLTASPDGTKLYAGVGSNSNITENGMPAELGPRRDLGDRPRHRRPPPVRHRPAQSQRPAVRAADATCCGRWSTSATSSAPTWCPTT